MVMIAYLSARTWRSPAIGRDALCEATIVHTGRKDHWNKNPMVEIQFGGRFTLGQWSKNKGMALVLIVQ